MGLSSSSLHSRASCSSSAQLLLGFSFHPPSPQTPLSPIAASVCSLSYTHLHKASGPLPIAILPLFAPSIFFFFSASHCQQVQKIVKCHREALSYNKEKQRTLYLPMSHRILFEILKLFFSFSSIKQEKIIYGVEITGSISCVC